MKNLLQFNSILQAIKLLNEKKIIAYPTEAVFGIGCDPDSETAVNCLLNLKKRHIKKGLILIASHFEQLKPYIDGSTLTPSQWRTVFSSWPGNVTFVFPAKLSTPYWLTGEFKSLAVRVTNHPLVVKLCHLFGKPIVSSSMNFSGFPPCRTTWEARKQFGNTFPIVEGKTMNGYLNPSEIRDALTGKCYRKG